MFYDTAGRFASATPSFLYLLLDVDALTRVLDDDSVLNRSSPRETGGVCVGVASCIASHGGGEGEGEGRVDGGHGRWWVGCETLGGGGGGAGWSLWRWEETFAT